MNTGDIVIVVKTRSLPGHWVGRYGKVVDNSADKVMVEFAARIGTMGSLTHTALRSDLKVVGRNNSDT